MVLNKVCCLYRHSQKCDVCQNYETLNSGNRKLYQCATCQQVFSEDKGAFLEGVKKPLSLIVKVLKAHSEGMVLNAACRVFESRKNINAKPPEQMQSRMRFGKSVTQAIRNANEISCLTGAE